MKPNASRSSVMAMGMVSALLACATGCTNGAIQPSIGSDAGPRADAQRPDPGCQSNAECGDGACLRGQCCSAERLCGDICCAGNQVCFANSCIVPGAPCLSSDDCTDNEYCEPSLGDQPPPPTVDTGHACVAAVPTPGRCLTMPPKCADGQPDPGDGSCLPSCEVHPEQGVLTADAEWGWNATNVQQYKDFVDVWSTPVVARVTDSNCDGKVNRLDPPNIIFVAGNAKGTCCSCDVPKADQARIPSTCQTGVLRVLDGATGREVFSLRAAEQGSKGFMGLSTATADIDRDGDMEILTVTGEGYLVAIDRLGRLEMKSDKKIPGSHGYTFGWGGALAVADMDGDGFPEVAYSNTVFTTKNNRINLVFTADGPGAAMSFFSDVDGNGTQDLITCGAAFDHTGTKLWTNPSIPAGCNGAVGDFDRDGKPEVAFVGSGKLWVLDAGTGALRAGPLVLPGTGGGGPPTVADFDGDGKPEVGVAKANFYSVTKVELGQANVAARLSLLWKQVNHDFSSSVTGSTVFDFDGDGKAEVVYNDECFLWVYDGKTGAVQFAAPTTSFTANEASLVADVDGDGRAEMVMVANRASPERWRCKEAPWTKPDPKNNRPAWVPPRGQPAHSGITVWGDREQAWVGTRTLWNQHSYHVTNICSSRDDACRAADNHYGAVPSQTRSNWTVPWLNNFRQNVQGEGLFDAPDATLSLNVGCQTPMTLKGTVRNMGHAPLPKGVEIGFYLAEGAAERLLAKATTNTMLFPGQAALLRYKIKAADNVPIAATFFARILNDPKQPTFRECRIDNNESNRAHNPCVVK